MEEEIFKKSEIIEEKLEPFGFIKESNYYIYKRNIEKDNFEIIIEVKNKKIKGKIIDKELNDEYLNYRVENQIGEYVNSIREEFIKLLEEIEEKCTYTKDFVFPQTNRISNHIKEKYHDKPEFLWEDNASGVFRNSKNKKWYGIIMSINKSKIDNDNKNVEVLNLKIQPEKIEELVKRKGYYKAYHMNKKYWITIVLDDEIEDNEIMELVEESYNYTIETNEWVIPANPAYWDIINCFNDKDEIYWKQNKGINEDDILYIYVGSPYSCLLYKCKVLKKDIESPFDEFDKVMKIKLLKRYPQDKYVFEVLKKYDLKAIRGARRMPKKLIDKLLKDEENEIK